MKEDDVLGKKLIRGSRIPWNKQKGFFEILRCNSAVLGLSELEFTTKVAQAIESASKKPPVIWLEGQALRRMYYIFYRYP